MKREREMDCLRVEEARIVVGVDFGTTFSGFAYALRAEPEKIYTFYDWPMQAMGSGRQYCKTHSSLRYVIGKKSGCYELADWGWTALANYTKALQSMASSRAGHSSQASSYLSQELMNIDQTAGILITRFKLHLAESHNEELPQGLSVEQVISDYLSALCQLIMTELKQRFGSHVGKEDVQWCITVPSIWDENAKQLMKICAERARLVGRPASQITDFSPHQLILALEPEAASISCQQKCQTLELQKGDKVLVADIGGGTVDIVVHELVSMKRPFKLGEIARSNGGLCGGSYVDELFFKFLSVKIRCFEEFAKHNPSVKLVIAKQWNLYKCEFSGSNGSMEFDLPGKLATAWEKHANSNGYASDVENYDQIKLSDNDLISIFDPVVKQILELIETSIIPNLRALFVVGGFSSSPYLMRKIREEFGSRVAEIMSPPDPGSAVCCGAVTLGLSDGIILSRVSRKTYGIDTSSEKLRPDDPPQYLFTKKNGKVSCKHRFEIFVRINTEVPYHHSISRCFYPVEAHKEAMLIVLFSSTLSDPIYTTGNDAKQEGSFTIRFPSKLSLGKPPEIEVTMYFGKSNIEVSARVTNSGDGEKASMLPVKFERNFC